MNFLSELEKRGLVQDCSDPELGNKVKPGDAFYIGFDPTAPSLHLGNFLQMLTMARLAQFGLKPIMLFGGATGQVGDPSGKSTERPILSLEEIARHVDLQSKQAKAIFERLGCGEIEYADNADWTCSRTYLDFLRDIGKYITVNYMTAKESVKSRLDGDGMSYAEFSYMLVQANDFLELYKNNNCKMQVGGSDQWGNMTCGLELIRKKLQGEAYSFSIPLLTDGNGKKYGKTEEGALWLDPQLTSPYKLHQFLLNTADEDVIKLITQLTFANFEEIESFAKTVKENPEAREAQNYLADTICTIIHGDSALELAKKAADVLFGGSLDGLNSNQLLDIFKDVPSSELPSDKILGQKALELFATTGTSKSKSEARRLIENGGAYVNNNRLSDLEYTLSSNDLIDQKVVILRSGKKSYHLIKAV